MSDFVATVVTTYAPSTIAPQSDLRPCQFLPLHRSSQHAADKVFCRLDWGRAKIAQGAITLAARNPTSI